jgi:bla regulator protein blaR1
MHLLFLHPLFSEEVLRAIGWTLIHSLWQGLLAAVLAGIVIAATRRSAARIRYNLLALVLILFVSATGVTFFLQKEETPAHNVADAITGVSNVNTVLPAGIQYETVQVKAASVIDRFVAYINTHADFFVLIWAIFFFIHCIKLITGVVSIQRLKTYKIHSPAEEWQERLKQLSKALGLRQSIILLESELVKIPAAIGYFKPVILVPLGLLSNLPGDQVEAILLHELAHIRRKDYVMNILQRFTEAVFFFNPALLWISSLIRQEREACCDDIVIADTNHKGSYLDALVSFQEYTIGAEGFAMQISSKKHYLLNRVKRMLTRENKKLDLMEKILLIAGLLVVTAFTFIPQKEVAAKKQQPNVVSDSTPAKTATRQRIVRPAVPPPPKSASKIEKPKPVVTNLSYGPLRDTVPVNSKEKTGNDGVKLQNLSTTMNVNDDGKTKTEIMEVTTEDGKTFKITKVNNWVKKLTIDGKDIPENEMESYKPLLRKLEAAVEENMAGRRKAMEARKADMALRQESIKASMAERHKQIAMMDKERIKERDQQLKELDKEQKVLEDRRQRIMEEKNMDKSKKEQLRKEFEQDRKRMDDKKREFEREKEMDNQKKERFDKQLEKEREMLEDRRKQMNKDIESSNRKRQELQQEVNRKKKMIDDQRRMIMREQFRKNALHIDSNGREIIMNSNGHDLILTDNRKGDGRVEDGKTVTVNKKADTRIQPRFSRNENYKEFSYASEALFKANTSMNALKSVNSKLFNDFKKRDLFITKPNIDPIHYKSGPSLLFNPRNQERQKPEPPKPPKYKVSPDAPHKRVTT